MSRGKVGPRLLFVAMALALCVGCVIASDQKLDARSMVRQLNMLRTYMEELEYIEEQEVHQGFKVKGRNTVAEDAMLELCDVVEAKEIKRNLDDDYQEEVKNVVKDWDKCLRLWTNDETIANWNFETDITNKTEEALKNATIKFTRLSKGLAQNAQDYMKDSRYNDLDPDLQRKLRFMAFSTDPDEEEDMEKLIDAQTKLQQTYSKATVDVPDLKQKDGVKRLKLEPELTEIMAQSKDSKLLLAAWLGWRDCTGPFMRSDYAEMVDLLNKGAQQHDFSNYAEAWMESQFDNTSNLEATAENLWENIRPLYIQLHAYVRTKLWQNYPEYNNIFNKGGIPAHLLGNMWAQNWENIYDLVKPYPKLEEPDYGAELKAQGYTAERMFETAENFYKSIGLFPVSDEFKTLSMKVRPENKEVVCHASASDFFSKKPNKDFRIKMCTTTDMDSFETVHHEMGHIEYFMAYQDQPAIYRGGANSAFHEAIGDTISLSVRSPKHLRAIGLDGGIVGGKKGKFNQRKRLTALIRELEEKRKQDINFLLKRALFKIGFLPFGYMIDKWRWGVFRGDTKKENYNREWWNLRLEYQGLVAPVTRSEADFDPGAKFHIPSNSPYICYFISFIVQFQFYEAMCEESGHTGPLFECDFYQSKEAGRKLLDMMKLGKSKPWPEAMERLTGSQNINTEAILKYFEPLRKWLEHENTRAGAHIGWEKAEINWETKS